MLAWIPYHICIHGTSTCPVKRNIPDVTKRMPCWMYIYMYITRRLIFKLHTNYGFNLKMDNWICRTMYIEHDLIFNFSYSFIFYVHGPRLLPRPWKHVFHCSNSRSKTYEWMKSHAIGQSVQWPLRDINSVYFHLWHLPLPDMAFGSYLDLHIT